MLDTIKSYFFMKKVMSLLSSKICLDLIKYNNNLKNKLDINILNYKIISGKYTKRGKEGIVKEYDVIMMYYYLKVNIKMEKEMEKEKNIINMEI